MQKHRERYEARLGTVIAGRWRLDRLLGWGSTSAVYLSHLGDERFAIKVLHPGLCGDPAVVRRFLREAEVGNAIRHRSIVRVHGEGVNDGSIYLVLDYVEGETLEEHRLRAGGRLPLRDLVPIVEELTSALSAVHAAKIVHRDLKPQNVFLTTTGELKLLDFGTARIFDAPAAPSGDDPISVDGLVIGTPSFMAPEQALGQRGKVDAQSDVWSLGATLFTMLSSEYVHPGRDAHQRLLAAASRSPRSLATVMPDLDAGVVAVIDRALAVEKADRWATVRAMRHAFRRAATIAGAVSESAPPPSDAGLPDAP